MISETILKMLNFDWQPQIFGKLTNFIFPSRSPFFIIFFYRSITMPHQIIELTEAQLKRQQHNQRYHANIARREQEKEQKDAQA